MAIRCPAADVYMPLSRPWPCPISEIRITTSLRPSETCASSGGCSSNAFGSRETFQSRNRRHSDRRSSATASSLRVMWKGLRSHPFVVLTSISRGGCPARNSRYRSPHRRRPPPTPRAPCAPDRPFPRSARPRAHAPARAPRPPAEGPVAFVPARHVELAGDVQHLVQLLRRRLVRQRRRRSDPNLRRFA